MSFTCPRCGATSHHPKDEEHGYCGACHDFTGHDDSVSAEDVKGILQTDPELQLVFDLRQAADEMAIAKWSAAHPDSELMIPDHADLVIWLLDQLAGVNHYEKAPDGVIDWKMEAERANRLYANIERINRVDAALAKRVGKMIERNSAIKVALTQWLRAYPIDIFPEPDLEKAAELLKAGGQTLDSVSANMARHVLGRVIEMFDDEKIIG